MRAIHLQPAARHVSPQLISVSRRTDVPALHGPWFVAQLDQGYADCRNPFGGTVRRISLAREEVTGFVFWSKNFTPFVPVLDEVARRGFPFYCLFTITGLDAPLEPDLPPLPERLACFTDLCRRFGPDRVVWRFDPIVISNRHSSGLTIERFRTLAGALAGSTNECIVSFVQFYAKVRRRLAVLEKESGITVRDPSADGKREMLAKVAHHAAAHGMRLNVCCQDDLVGGPVGKAHCVDIERFRRCVPNALPDVPRKGTRRECGCSFSRDIGTYHTCRQSCAYCYANA